MGNQPSKPPSAGGSGTSGHSHSQSDSQPARHPSQHLSRRSQHAAAPPADPNSTGSSPAPLSPLSPPPHLDGPSSPAARPRAGRQHLPKQRHHHHVSADAAMGNSQSTDAPSSASSSRRTTARNFDGHSGDVHSSPVQVPAGGQHRHQQHQSQQQQQQQQETSGQQTRRRAAEEADAGGEADDEDAPPGRELLVSPQDDDYAPKFNLNFPPRLPLPIQEEVYTPGSPIISPDDLAAQHEDAALPHRTSLLSHTTADDDDDDRDFESPADRGRTVPTVVTWRGKLERVYVTGSFANWGRKFRMHRDPNDPELLSTKLDLMPGTHHLRFIVDGEMRLSTDLPTAVDYTTALVNYLEVSADDIPPDDDGKSEQPPDVQPSPDAPSGVEQTDWQSKADESEKQQPEKKYLPRSTVHYSGVIPQYLPDLDRDADSNRFRRSMNAVNDIPPPPSLPLFLGKSILNGSMPVKDDSSVLNMPSHTVLNHLATSSIKNDVLATSVTTRYRRKYITTITYRPTREDD